MSFILTKMGRSIGFYFDMAMTVASRNANVYLDVVGTSPEHLKTAVGTIGADRIMFGSDWCFSWRWVREPQPLHQLRLSVVDDAGLAAAEREWILHRTAERVFRLTP